VTQFLPAAQKVGMAISSGRTTGSQVTVQWDTEIGA